MNNNQPTKKHSLARANQWLGRQSLHPPGSQHPLVWRICLVLIIVVLAVYLLRYADFPIGWDFRNNLWAPSHLLANNQSPYQVQQLFETSNAVWMPPAIGLFWPLGLLPLSVANTVWLLINLCVYLATLYLAMAVKNFWRFIGLVLLCATFPFLMGHFVLVQISLLICLAVLVLVEYHSLDRPLLGGLCWVVALIKPQLMVVCLPLLIWQLTATVHRTPRVHLFAAVVVWCAVLLAPLFIAYPDWLQDFLMNLRSNPRWAHPNLHTLLWQWYGVPRAFTTVVMLALTGLFFWWSSPRQNWKSRYLFGLAFTTVVSPYIWSWDFVLLLPLYVHTLSSTEVVRWRKRVLLSGSVLIMGMYAYQKVSLPVDDRSAWWVSLVFLGLLLLANQAVLPPVRERTASRWRGIPRAGASRR